MPGLLELEQEDLRDLDHVTDAFLRASSLVDSGIEPPGFAKDFRKYFGQLAEEVVALTLGFAARLRPRWEEYKRAGWGGHARQVHALRGSLLRTFEARLGYLAQAVRLASTAAVLTARPVPESHRLPAAISDLAALKEEIFARWDTLEDLEQILVETYPFTAAQFDGLAQRYHPSPEWYSQEEQLS